MFHGVQSYLTAYSINSLFNPVWDKSESPQIKDFQKKSCFLYLILQEMLDIKKGFMLFLTDPTVGHTQYTHSATTIQPYGGKWMT